ncbi:MAG: energy transducer TonB [Gelidibacter sp.]|nr:energy transducer TonB [Gelidibacter sp.]
MKNQKNTTDVAGQSNKSSVVSQKHAVNLQKNSTLYFQVGLIICLLVTFGVFEMNFEKTNHDYAIVDPIDEISEFAPEVFEIEKTDKQKVDEKKTSVVITKEPIEKENDYVEKLPTQLFTEPQTSSNTTAKIDEIDKIEKIIEEDHVFSTIGVEKVPIYPGCESAKNNKQRLECMSEKLSKLVQRNFDLDLATELGLTGTQKIDIAFKIDKNGNIADVKARAPHHQLEKEAVRLTTKIPKMQPGKQREKPVTVMYNLPIIFKVQ